MPENNLDTGSRLMLRARHGDRRAFEHVYNGYRNIVFEYLATHQNGPRAGDIEEVLQEAFEDAWRCRNQFSGRVPVKKFLLGLANLAYWRNPSASVQSNASLPEAKQAAIADRLATIVRRIMSRFSRNQKQALWLIATGRLSLAEAAEFVGCAAEALAQQWHIALPRLDTVLSACGAGCPYRKCRGIPRTTSNCPARAGRGFCFKYALLERTPAV